jgi:hypothetical protein
MKEPGTAMKERGAAMSSGCLGGLNRRKPRNTETAMSTPFVIEITRRPEPVVHDPFIDDLRVPPAAMHRIGAVPSDPCVTDHARRRKAVTPSVAGCYFDVRMPPSNR